MDERRTIKLSECYKGFADSERKVIPIISKCLEGMILAAKSVDEHRVSRIELLRKCILESELMRGEWERRGKLLNPVHFLCFQLFPIKVLVLMIVSSIAGICSLHVLLFYFNLKMFNIIYDLDALFCISWNIPEYQHGWCLLWHVALNWIKYKKMESNLGINHCPALNSWEPVGTLCWLLNNSVCMLWFVPLVMLLRKKRTYFIFSPTEGILCLLCLSLKGKIYVSRFLSSSLLITAWFSF